MRIRKEGDEIDVGERIKHLRKEKGFTQQAFADKLGLKRQTIAAYEIGTISPSDRTILDICREFNVLEEWLRTGEGDMLIPRSRTDDISAFVGDILRGEPDFRQKFISVLARMTTDEWKILEKKITEISEEIKKADP